MYLIVFFINYLLIESLQIPSRPELTLFSPWNTSSPVDVSMGGVGDSGRVRSVAGVSRMQVCKHWNYDSTVFFGHGSNCGTIICIGEVLLGIEIGLQHEGLPITIAPPVPCPGHTKLTSSAAPSCER